MTDIEERIAEVLERHWFCPVNREPGRCGISECAWRGTEEQHQVHVAAVLAAALRAEMREGRRTRSYGLGPLGVNEAREQRRWVTAWEWTDE